MEKGCEKYDPHEFKPSLNEIIITQPIVSQKSLDSLNQYSRPVSLVDQFSVNPKGQFLDGQLDQRKKMETKEDDRGERCGGYWLCCWPNQFSVTGANNSDPNWAAGSAGADEGCCDCMYGDCGDCCDCGDCGDCGDGGDCGDCGDCNLG